MSVGLTKYQKQGLGAALASAGYSPDDFIYADEPAEDDNHEYVSLTHRESSERFAIRRAIGNNHSYYIRSSEPGTNREQSYGGMSWNDVERNLESWAQDVQREDTAIDPWQQEAEDMANDDSLFSLDELPRVDRAIEESLENLKTQAIEHGKTAEQIEGELQEIKRILQKSARNSTKREWISIFKGIIVGKLIDWGMQPELYQNVLHTLITAAQDVAQLAEHAARHIQ